MGLLKGEWFFYSGKKNC